MNDTAIIVENLSKCYRIGAREEGYKTFRETIIDVVSAPIRNFRRLRGLTEFEQNSPSRSTPSTENGSSDVIWALRDVSFEVEEGVVLGIIGRNGAGKSTLLKILSRITDPSRGDVKIYGRVSSLLEVGTGFHPELTGRENIYLNGAILGMRKSEIHRKFDEIVDFAEIEKFIDTPVKRYSSGMYVRLAFAVAAHLEPEIMVVDEVLAVGDVEFQKKCLGKMQAVGKEGRTIIFVSHNMAAISKLCQRAILLDGGRILADGSTDLVVGRYLGQDAASLSASIILPGGDFKNHGSSLATLGENAKPAGIGSHLHFFSGKGERKALFLLDESWRIVLEFEIFKRTPHCIAAIGLATIDQIAIATFWSRPQDLPPGRYVVEFDVRLPLKACELQFTIGLSSYERSFYYKENIGRVSIVEVTDGKQPIRARGAGFLQTPQTAQIMPLT
jgi:ABC-type polysaccharide/polyol phosphate transport system ATPase subunit